MADDASDAPPRILGQFSDYNELITALRARAAELGMRSVIIVTRLLRPNLVFKLKNWPQIKIGRRWVHRAAIVIAGTFVCSRHAVTSFRQ